MVREVPPKAVERGGNYRALDISAIQREFLEMRLQQVLTTRSGVVVLDRTVDEDRYVFLRLHQEIGGLSGEELARLDQLAEYTGTRIGAPAATVILRADPDILRNRITDLSRPAWLAESLDRQLELYAALVANTRGAILEVDTTNRSPETLTPTAAWIVATAPLAAAKMPTSDGPDGNLRWAWR